MQTLNAPSVINRKEISRSGEVGDIVVFCTEFMGEEWQEITHVLKLKTADVVTANGGKKCLTYSLV